MMTRRSRVLSLWRLLSLEFLVTVWWFVWSSPDVFVQAQQQQSQPSGEACVLSSPEPLKDYLTFAHGVNLEQGTITVQLVYEGQAWLSVGRSDDGKMIGGEVVTGAPEEENSSTNPGKYIMTSDSFRGVNLMENAQQTLMDASIIQNDTHTVLTYTKYLQEPSEWNISAAPSGTEETWIWAIGMENEYPTMHEGDGSFSIVTYTPCGVATAAENGIETSASVKEITRTKWVVHGILMGLAWGIMVPLAIGASLVRAILFPGTPVWYTVHHSLNFLAVLCTTVGMALGIAAIQQEGKTHMIATFHAKAGLALFILAVLQAMMGYVKPPAPSAAATALASKADVDDERDAQAELETVSQDSARKQQQLRNPYSNAPARKTWQRTLWEWKHRILGATLWGLAWYASSTGCHEFQTKYAQNVFPIFWGVFCSVSGTVLLLALIVQCFL